MDLSKYNAPHKNIVNLKKNITYLKKNIMDLKKDIMALSRKYDGRQKSDGPQKNMMDLSRK